MTVPTPRTPDAPAPRDVPFEAHRAAEARLELLGRLEERECEGETVDPEEWPPTAGPYCGCSTCDLREGLFAAWPVFLAGVVETLVAAGHGGAAELVHEALAVPADPLAARVAA